MERKNLRAKRREGAGRLTKTGSVRKDAVKPLEMTIKVLPATIRADYISSLMMSHGFLPS